MKNHFVSLVLLISVLLSSVYYMPVFTEVNAVEGDTEVFIPQLGDATGDGRVSIADLLVMRKHLAGLNEETVYIKINGDINCDDRITIMDVLQLRKYIADIIDFSESLFSVMTYNVGLWYDGSGGLAPEEEYSKYLKLNETILDTYKPDVLCLQEYCSQLSPGKSAVDNLLGSRYKNIVSANCAPNYCNYIGKAICSNNSITDATNSHFGDNNGDDSPNYEKAYVDIDGKNVCVISAHLSYNPYYAYIMQLPELVRAVTDEEYFIICLDSNINIKEGNYYNDIINLFSSFSVSCNICNGGSKGSFNTYPSQDMAIDNIITSSNIKPSSVFVDKHKDILLDDGDQIDHYPLIAYFIFE